MKTCATCVYFVNGDKGSVCTIKHKLKRKFNPYSGEMETWESGIYAKFMRSDEGECGPERKLYKQKLSSKITPYFNWFVLFVCIVFISYVAFVCLSGD